MKKKTLSVVLATHNEEKNLADCLEAIKGIADEIVVVDGDSEDNTVNIAKDFNARVIITNNPPIFHINKNKAIDASRSDWVLQLDADEIVSADLAKEIINGYWIPRSNLFLGSFLKKGGQYPDYTLRLYRRGKGRLPAKDVHEQAVVEGKVGYLKNDLLHLRDKNFSEYYVRFRRYTDLLAAQLGERGVKISLFSFVNYIFIKPLHWFLKVFVRHKGFVDGYPGFVFAFFSSLRFPVSYYKFWRRQRFPDENRT